MLGIDDLLNHDYELYFEHINEETYIMVFSNPKLDHELYFTLTKDEAKKLAKNIKAIQNVMCCFY